MPHFSGKNKRDQTDSLWVKFHQLSVLDIFNESRSMKCSITPWHIMPGGVPLRRAHKLTSSKSWQFWDTSNFIALFKTSKRKLQTLPSPVGIRPLQPTQLSATVLLYRKIRPLMIYLIYNAIKNWHRPRQKLKLDCSSQESFKNCTALLLPLYQTLSNFIDSICGLNKWGLIVNIWLVLSVNNKIYVSINKRTEKAL